MIFAKTAKMHAKTTVKNKTQQKNRLKNQTVYPIRTSKEEFI